MCSDKFPLLTLGTFKIRGIDAVRNTIDAGLQCGFRSIDTAEVYRNEAEIGQALATLLNKHSLNRADVHLTSKLAPKSQGAEKCRAAYLETLRNLGVEYLDLYLIHWPGAQKVKPNDPKNAVLRKESWQEMEKLCQAGKLRKIGVSNYTLKHMEELLSYCLIKPAVLQVEHHPHLVQKELVEFCRRHDIFYQAYSSLGTSAQDNQLLNDPVVKQLASVYNKSPAQILLKWAVQQNIGVIPKSTNPTHIQENSDIFDFMLEDIDMDKLSSLDKQLHYCWDPKDIT